MLSNSAPVRVFNESLTLLAEIDSYKNLYFTQGWNSPGDFQLQINYNIVDSAGFRYADYFQRGRFILINGDWKKIGVITEIKKSLKKEGKGSQIITVKGKQASYILSRRVVEPQAGSANYSITGAAETVMKSIVTAQAGTGAISARQIGILNVPSSTGIGASYTYSSRYKNMLSDLSIISEATNIGFWLELNPSTLKLDFKCGAGLDRTTSQSVNPRMIISANYDSIESGELTDSEITYKNIIYAAGQGVGDSRNIRKVYSAAEPTGLDRREAFSDMRELVSNADIDAKGASELAANSSTKFIDAETLVYSQFVLGVDYNLGDLVTLSIYNETMDARITEVKESWSNGKYDISLGFNRKYPELPTQIKSNNQAIGQSLANSDGVLVESGSNANGSWQKFSDGNMIQWGTSLVSIAINVANGSVFNSNGSPTVTMPKSFIDTSYSVTSCGDGYVWGGPIRSGKTVNSFSNYLFYATSLALADRYIHWQAIGRWRA